jgi:GH24 family phage-related lysozyme (muramidase)
MKFSKINGLVDFVGVSSTPIERENNRFVIGVSHPISEGFDLNLSLTHVQIEELLNVDISLVESFLNDLNEEALSKPLSQNQFDALVLLSFEMGFEKFERSPIVMSLSNNDVEDVIKCLNFMKLNSSTFVKCKLETIIDLFLK